jgi:hypothetical protein
VHLPLLSQPLPLVEFPLASDGAADHMLEQQELFLLEIVFVDVFHHVRQVVVLQVQLQLQQHRFIAASYLLELSDYLVL